MAVTKTCASRSGLILPSVLQGQASFLEFGLANTVGPFLDSRSPTHHK